MRPHVVANGTVPTDIVDLDVAEARAFLDRLPERSDLATSRVVESLPGLEHPWSCHVLVRLVARALGQREWTVADGFFGRYGVQHSWLWTRGPRGPIVMDVYPVAGVGPHVVAAEFASPWQQLYIHQPGHYDPDVVDGWDREAEAVSRAASGRWLHGREKIAGSTGREFDLG